MKERGLFVRGEAGIEDRTGPDHGPFPEDWLQLTYKSLRCGPEGEEIAVYTDGDNPGWIFVGKHREKHDPVYTDLIAWWSD